MGLPLFSSFVAEVFLITGAIPSNQDLDIKITNQSYPLSWYSCLLLVFRVFSLYLSWSTIKHSTVGGINPRGFYIQRSELKLISQRFQLITIFCVLGSMMLRDCRRRQSSVTGARSQYRPTKLPQIPTPRRLGVHHDQIGGRKRYDQSFFLNCLAQDRG